MSRSVALVAVYVTGFLGMYVPKAIREETYLHAARTGAMPWQRVARRRE